MAITPTFTQADVKEAILKRLDSYRKAVIERLKQAGEKFVNFARLSGRYTDQTGNLRSSVGYILLYNGVTISEDFKQVKSGSEGVSKGKQEALNNAPKTGYALVCVAGMEYAAAVEAKGRDVITGSSQIVEGWLKNALDNLKNKIK